MKTNQLANQYQLLVNDLVATRSLDGKKQAIAKIKAFETANNYDGSKHTQRKVK